MTKRSWMTWISALALGCGLGFGRTAHAAEGTTTSSDYVFPPPDESLLRLLSQDDIAFPDSFWLQAGAGGSFFDVRNQNWAPRWGPSLAAGERFGRFGVFVNVAIDETFDLTQEVKILNLLNVGVGFEHLALLGRLRSSASVGASILESDTDIDTRGTVGWYADIRPLSLRWGPIVDGVFELSPLGVNISVPVTHGIPLILFSYFTTISYEWNFESWHRTIKMQQ